MATHFEQPVKAHIGLDNYLIAVSWRNGTIVSDEPVDLGGQDRGPDPYSLLLASLASCTVATLRMYADRKNWDIPEFTVEVNLIQIKEPELSTTLTRKIIFPPSVEESVKERLLIVAQKCPVSKILEGKIVLTTQ